MDAVAGYAIRSTWYDWGGVALVQGEKDGVSRVLKVVRTDQALPEALERLEREARLTGQLDPRWALRPLELMSLPNAKVLLLDGTSGRPLAGSLGAPWPLERFLAIARRLAEALEGLHGQGFVHRDLKPENVVLDEATGEVKLMGFGLARQLPRDSRDFSSPERIEGTLAYMAPEQTGRMNRAIDARTDLYALGVMLYQLLTGNLPCQGRDPLEWIHCQIAVTPRPPSELDPGLAAPVSELVVKLLAKDPEDRYQTAAGLKFDLERIQADWQAGRAIAAFPLGQHDVSDRFQVSQKLYGREHEIAAMKRAFGRVVASGAPELILVRGYPGVGKTTLVRRMVQPLVRERCLFLSGKFDRLNRETPYFTLVQAFRDQVRRILAGTEAAIADWRARIQAVLGLNGQLIVDIIPQLEVVIGPQAPLLELPAAEARQRFQRVFRRFVGVFATREHPVILLLDDLQWADKGSLALIRDLATQPDTGTLLLIGAFRDNEVGARHPLALMVAELEQSRARIESIALGPLSEAQVARLLADTLRCTLEHVGPLAHLVFVKTAGNPFFVIQFLTTLWHDDLLSFDLDSLRWRWDLARIEARGFTDNVVELLVGRLKKLPVESQNVMTLAAAVGNRADVETLAAVAHLTEAQTRAQLEPALREGLLQCTDDAYQIAHDRVQEAAYSLIPEARRASVHLRIGRSMLSVTPPAEIAAKVFDLVSQLNLGAGLIRDPEEKRRLLELDLLAGRRAKHAMAYASAVEYLEAGQELLPPDAWQVSHELTFALHLELAECQYMVGNFAEAERLIVLLERRVRSRRESAAVARVAIELYMTRDRGDLAVATALKGLRGCGIELTAHPTWDEVRREYQRVSALLGDRPVEDLIDLPSMADADQQLAMDLLMAVLPPAMFTDLMLAYSTVLHMVALSLRFGAAEASGFAFAQFGQVLGSAFGEYRLGERFGRLGVALAERTARPNYRDKVYLTFGAQINPWTRPLETSLESLDRAFDLANRVGDLTIACYAAGQRVALELTRGTPLERLYAESERAIDFVRRANFGLIEHAIVAMQRLIEDMRGRTADISVYDGPDFDQAAYEAFLAAHQPHLAIAACWYYVRQLQARVITEDVEAALAAAAKAEALMWTSATFLERAEFHYYGALAESAAARRELAPLALETVRAHLAALQGWAEHCPENFQAKAALVGAELARMEERIDDAMRLYEVAIRSARANGFVQNEAIAYEVASRFYRDRGLDLIADTYLGEARSCYLRWGAQGKVKQLDRRHPHLSERLPSGRSAESILTAGQLDALTVIKASQAISHNLVLSDLVVALLRIVIENAGAQNGCLLLPDGAEWRAAAVASVADGRMQVSAAGSEAVVLPESILAYVRRTHDRVLLDDASAQGPFSSDPYVVERRPKSLLCLPITRQADVIALLYLENSLVAGAFTTERLAILEHLASQAAISLENAALYSDLLKENAVRKQAELALRESEERLRAILDNSTALIFLKNPEGQYLLVNPWFATVMGRSRSEILGKTVFELMRKEQAEAISEDDRQVRERRIPLEFEEAVDLKDGLHTFVAVKFPLFDHQGRLYAIGGIATDITERKQTTEEIARRTAELKQAQELDRLKNNFVNAVSHELRTPLTSIMGYTEFLEDEIGGPLSDPQKGFIAQIQAGTRRLGRLVDDLLDFARIDAGTFRLRIEPADLGAMARAIAESFRPQAETAHIHLEIAVPEAPLIIPMDPQRLEQVIGNLLSNALKFTPEGGSVRMGLRQEGDHVRCEIRDTGVGIAPEDVPKLFQRFSQLAAGTSKRGGTGLGLSISKSIVEAHGGTIGVSSEPGYGSTFWFTLPAQAAPSVTVSL